ncbi:hypothetical protein ACEWY4_025708 [Coilia grayii]|uniref:DNA cross-link repair 1A protein n=1 Tax=Coilia grayii TaxID=363190 RepID=A0ABD1ISQ1_9TELE
MSQSSSESDIWEYKSLRKAKRHNDNQNTKGSSQGRGKRKSESVSQERSNKNKRTYAGKNTCSVANRTSANTQSRNDTIHMKQMDGGLFNKPPPSDTANENKSVPVNETPKPPPTTGHCPVCQMPFSVLVVQSPRWHVAECLETPGNNSQECPDGVQCSSTIPSHYKKYSHFLLAHSRAISDDRVLALSQDTLPDQTTTSCHLRKTQNISINSATFETSLDTAECPPSLSDQSAALSPALDASSQPSTPSQSNALLLLRSPAPEDIKKKKGWSPSGKGIKPTTKTKALPQVMLVSVNDKPACSNPVNMDRETEEIGSTLPHDPDCVDQSTTKAGVMEEEGCSDFLEDDYISFSPLSEFPNIAEKHGDQPRRELFPVESSDLQESSSEAALSESDDDLFSEFMDQCDLEQSEDSKDGPLLKDSFNTHLALTSTSLAEQHQLTAPGSTGATELPSLHDPSVLSKETKLNTSLQSPQSIVLERLRDCLSSQVFNTAAERDSCSHFNQSLSQKPLSQSSTQLSTTMAPGRTKSKAGATSSGLKQTDIGVFFGLKPLKVPEKKTEAGGSDNVLSVQSSQQTSDAPAGNIGRSRWRRRKDPEVGSGSTENGETQPVETNGGRGQGGWRRWNRRGGGTGNGQEYIRPCPFYKKIPGTPFAVDAFSYGAIEGITAYFLTHFHSDHYGGLTKASTVPVYCNKITGNLVKSKLKVDEKYVHVLPMNTECTVEGVRVTLLDANHCPGSAMLLLTLPNGQRILHTGDFRADPSMERYPELQGFRVHTLYLDTTYCSPEYTFPTQQEVITFAANRAFEAVTLSPRTLVVCGTYSVGKEKVFLAVADVLGCKVCLSRDKFNTMCCLESDQICQNITTNWKAAQVHVLPMMQLNFQKLQTHLNRFSDKYDQLVAFKPTGWTFDRGSALESLQPQTQGNITIYGIPYSEHSSFLELKRFVQWLRPQKIIPTVNVGSWRSRKAMEHCFSEWGAEGNSSSTHH